MLWNRAQSYLTTPATPATSTVASLRSGGGHIRAGQIGGRADLQTDGGNIAVNYTFYWEGNKADMKYSVSRQPPKDS